MRFVEKVVGPDEHLLGIVSVHWIYGAKGLLWLGGLAGIAFFLDIFLTSFFGAKFGADAAFIVGNITNVVFWVATTIGAIMFLFYFVMMISTELGLTDQRIIYKKGLILVDTKEIDLEEIKAADIDHGILGRFLNYGYIRLDARFIKDVELPAIAKPYKFMKAMNDMRSRMKEEGSLHHILEEHHRYNGGKHEDEKEEIHDIDDPHYNTIDKNPASALGEIIDEAKESFDSHEEEAKKQIPPEPAPPVFAKKEAKQVPEEPENSDKSEKQEISKAVENAEQRQELRRELEEDFERTIH